MDILVTPQWLNERLSSGNLVILDATLPPVGVLPRVDTRARYLQAHLPRAVFFDIDALSDASSGLPHTMPQAGSFSQAMSALGVGDSMTIVVYEQEGVFSAPRALWMLRSFGAGDVHLLQGGLRAWKDAGLPVEAGEVQLPAARFEARLQPGAVATFADVQASLAAGGQILDARSAGRFDGSAPEPRPGLSSGHMPGATSMPYTELVSGGALKRPDELREVLQRKGVDLTRPIMTSCGSGVTAAVVSLALEVAGAKEIALYDGSWAEYAQHPEAKIEKGGPVSAFAR